MHYDNTFVTLQNISNPFYQNRCIYFFILISKFLSSIRRKGSSSTKPSSDTICNNMRCFYDYSQTHCPNFSKQKSGLKLISTQICAFPHKTLSKFLKSIHHQAVKLIHARFRYSTMNSMKSSGY